MTSHKNAPHSLDRFGLRPSDEKGGPAPQRPVPASHWVPIRDLHARHRRRILDHLLSLNERDRYLRFGFQAPLEQLAKYVASIDFRRDEVFGIFNRKLQLVAVAHLAATPGGDPKDAARGKVMEFGVSVSPDGRGKGLGLCLFQHAVTHARNRGASHLVIHALSENAPMLRIATKGGAVLERDGQDTEGLLKLPPDTVGSHLDSSVQSLAAEVIYRVKYRVIHISDWLRALGSSAL